MGSPQIVAAFGEDQAQRLSGVSASQLRYWDRIDFFRPTFAESSYRGGFGRVYAFRDIVALRVLNTLRNKLNVSLQHLRQVKDRLQSTQHELWTGVRLFVLNQRVVWVEPENELPQEVVSGQYVMETIDLAAEVEATKADIRKLNIRDPSSVGKVERRKLVNQKHAVVAGTRVTVQAIKRFAKAGYDVNAILREYPDLTERDVKAALEYEKAA